MLLPCSLMCAEHCHKIFRRTPEIDVAALERPEIQAKIVEDIRGLSRVPWEVEPTSHRHIITEQIKEVLTNNPASELSPELPKQLLRECVALLG